MDWDGIRCYITSAIIRRLEESQRRRLRTSNMCDDLNRKFKRRTRVGGLFPNKTSVLCLVTDFVMETSEEWETDNDYRNLTPQNSIPNTHNQQQPVALNQPPNQF